MFENDDDIPLECLEDEEDIPLHCLDDDDEIPFDFLDEDFDIPLEILDAASDIPLTFLEEDDLPMGFLEDDSVLEAMGAQAQIPIPNARMTAEDLEAPLQAKDQNSDIPLTILEDTSPQDSRLSSKSAQIPDPRIFAQPLQSSNQIPDDDIPMSIIGSPKSDADRGFASESAKVAFPDRSLNGNRSPKSCHDNEDIPFSVFGSPTKSEIPLTVIASRPQSPVGRSPNSANTDIVRSPSQSQEDVPMDIVMETSHQDSIPRFRDLDAPERSLAQSELDSTDRFSWAANEPNPRRRDVYESVLPHFFSPSAVLDYARRDAETRLRTHRFRLKRYIELKLLIEKNLETIQAALVLRGLV